MRVERPVASAGMSRSAYPRSPRATARSPVEPSVIGNASASRAVIAGTVQAGAGGCKSPTGCTVEDAAQHARKALGRHGVRIHHVDGMTIEETGHAIATRLYQNMAKVHFDQNSGKSTRFGKRLSHSHRRSSRRWNPNVQKVRAVVDGTPKRLHVCTSCLKAGKVTKR